MRIILFLAATVARATSSRLETTLTKATSSESRARAVDNRPVFSPRMDYDEWTPLGRGDPLKNDPTYDYVPPVLDRVHYWMDPSKRTPDPPLPKSDVMVLGTRTEVPVTTVPVSSRLGTMSLLDPFLKFMDASKASLGLSSPSSTGYFRPTPNPSYYQPPHHNSPKYGPPKVSEPVELGPPPPPPSSPKIQALQRPPYTMLMPPPPPAAPCTELPMTSFGTSTRTTSEAEDTLSTVTTTMTSASGLGNEVTTTTTKTTTTASLQTTILANSENLYKPVAINMPESISNETNELLPTTPITHPTNEYSMTLPIVSIFNDNSNHLQYQEIKPPSDIMVPPPHKINDYFGFLPTTVRTTTSRTLTTDPMFKHYKQPSEPMRGPFYLIIQGHSKVKTYGASKNKVKPLSSNEINFDDGKSRNYDASDSEENNRRERKLRTEDSDYVIDEDNEEVIEGRPTIELMASFQSNGFSVSDNQSVLGDLDGAFPSQAGGKSKKRILMSEPPINSTLERRKRFVSRRLLANTTPSSSPNSDKDTLDEQQLGLESLIALNDDYNSEDVINLLLKEEGQGSGFGGLVASLLSKSLKSKEEI